MSTLTAWMARAALWLAGDSRTTTSYLVPSSGWPGGVRDSDPPVERLYELLDDTFDNYHDTAVASLAGEVHR